MGIAIYYFSGTGNCLSTAKCILEKVKGRLLSIPEVINQHSIRIDTNNIGIVFPVYLTPLSGIPLIVERFIRKLENIESKYLFAVCTCGGYEIVNALPTLRNLSKLVKSIGGKLSAKYSVRLPMNNLDYAHIPVPINTDQEIIFKNCNKKLEGICERIANKKAEKLFELQQNEKILDIACGHGNFSRRLVELKAMVTAIDFSPELIERAKLRSQKFKIDYRIIDATDYNALINLGINVFDSVMPNLESLIYRTCSSKSCIIMNTKKRE